MRLVTASQWLVSSSSSHSDEELTEHNRERHREREGQREREEGLRDVSDADENSAGKTYL